VAKSNGVLGQSPQYLKGVGPARTELLRRLGIETIRDLLFHFPRSYDDLSDVRPIVDLTAGTLQTTQGEVVEIEGKTLADGRTIVSIVLSDGGRSCLEGIWFNQPYAARPYRFGQRLAFSGKPKWHRDHWQMTNPRVQVLETSSQGDGSPIVPVYPLTGDLRADQLRPVIREAVDRYAPHLSEELPPELRLRRGFAEAPLAMRQVHLPATLAEAKHGRRRFLYEEFLILQVALALRRRDVRDREQAPPLPVTAKINARIRRLFPFRLTTDQDRAVREICRDLAGQRPMQRLLQADVGAGKTAVAVYALLLAIANKHQAALMAPTEVLARQHWHTVERYLAQSRVRRLLLTGALRPKERRAALRVIQAGEIDLVIGTQALIQDDVEFARLGLVVIDEQHKFGVHQRARIRRLGIDPHYLVMTATPIPRTVALTVFGDLDVSLIRQLPPGRQPVKTQWLSENRRDWVYEQVRDGLSKGRQGYVVCPLIATSAQREQHGAQETFEELRAGPFRDFRLGLLHGQIEDKAKDEVMQRFRARELDLLVSTTIVEVGLDVGNATLLVVEDADSFGLSQLHQLRGRVSRGTVSGECYLIANAGTADAKDRLRLFSRSSDGFALAEQDARLRGVGEFFGARQHGAGELAMDDLFRNAELLKLARQDAIKLVAEDSGLRRPENTLLRQAVLARYGKTLDLSRVG
jgi:ATP-dependent DNA helicase RecG